MLSWVSGLREEGEEIWEFKVRKRKRREGREGERMEERGYKRFIVEEELSFKREKIPWSLETERCRIPLIMA